MQRDLARRATRVILQAQGFYATDPIAILQLPTSVTAARTLKARYRRANADSAGAALSRGRFEKLHDLPVPHALGNAAKRCGRETICLRYDTRLYLACLRDIMDQHACNAGYVEVPAPRTAA